MSAARLPRVRLPCVRLLVVSALLAVLLPAGRALATQTLVIFEVELPAGAGVDGRAATDALRARATAGVPASVKVLQRDEIEALLPPAPGGGRLSLAECEGDCALQTGRTLGVDLFMTARLRREGQTWYATVALTRTSDGRMIGQGLARLTDHRAALMKAADAALSRWLEAAPRDLRLAERVPSTGVPMLEIRSDVQAHIRIDGRRVGQTPVRTPVPTRYVRVEASAEGYATERLTVDVGPMSGRLALQMTPTTGLVLLSWPDGYQELSLWIDGKPAPLTEALRLPPGPHRVQVRSPCGDSAIIPFEVELGGVHPVRAPIKARCPQVALKSRGVVEVRIDGTIYHAPTTTHRMRPGPHRVELIGRVEPWHTITVPEAASDVVEVRLPRRPHDFGAELGWQHRGDAGGLGFLRFLSHHRSAHTPRWGVHVGVGLILDDLPQDHPSRSSFGGLFLGTHWRYPLTHWLEWSMGGEVAFGAAETGVPLFLGVDAGLQVQLPHVAVGVGWGAAVHTQVRSWQDVHGLRLSVALTE